MKKQIVITLTEAEKGGCRMEMYGRIDKNKTNAMIAPRCNNTQEAIDIAQSFVPTIKKWMEQIS